MPQKTQYSFLNDSTYSATWKAVGLVILCIRFVQGWIFWAGGSRRLIYAPQKMDPHATVWMANKLQSSMPGALFGMGHVVSFLLQHFYFLYLGLVLVSLAELLSGLGLIFGFFTRLAGFITALISILMMVLFGWQGSTCVDEWTMAVSGVGIGLTLALAGGGIFSVDHWLLSRYPHLTRKKWFIVLASGPVSFHRLRILSSFFLLFTIIFTVGTYNYYRGAVFTPYHSGSVDPAQHHVALSDGTLQTNGTVIFTAYIDSGTPALPTNIIRVELQDMNGKIIEEWEGKQLRAIATQNIKNIYRYNQFYTGPYGLVAPVGSKAVITLIPTQPNLRLSSGNYLLQVFTINGHRWTLSLKL